MKFDGLALAIVAVIPLTFAAYLMWRSFYVDLRLQHIRGQEKE